MKHRKLINILNFCGRLTLVIIGLAILGIVFSFLISIPELRQESLGKILRVDLLELIKSTKLLLLIGLNGLALIAFSQIIYLLGCKKDGNKDVLEVQE